MNWQTIMSRGSLIGTKKEEIREPFSRFGKVMDVYLGLKKDYYRRNFSFVRYVGIKDIEVLESKLQGIKCRGNILEVNISKHQWKPKQHQQQQPIWQPVPRKNMQTNNYHGEQKYYLKLRGNRPYAQFINDTNGKKSQQHTSTITLNPNTFMTDWLKKGVLIGETHSLDHMANIHALANRRDYSMGKVGVLTSSRRWINEEITINSNGQEFKVGVVEYTDEWSPFKPTTFDKVDEHDEDDNNTEGISETWMEEETEEPEEGEIRPEAMAENLAQPVDHQTPATVKKTSVTGGNKKSPSNAPLEPNHETSCFNVLNDLNAGTSHEVPSAFSRSIEHRDAPVKHMMDRTPKVGPSATYNIGPLENGGGHKYKKKRKRDKVVLHSPNSLIQDSNSNPPISMSKLVASNFSNEEMDSIVNLLNGDGVSPINNNPQENNESSQSPEARDTAAIGNLVGFQIDATDPGIAETEAESGEKFGNL
ncbi:unnamed protein product [Lactuca virosa]|uniref:RRM domain-containing protein n=1 Tax=Lactuca virosa TaxID=75947 RepID=A0AAU9NKC5_9ASTR|nr:unnamed protein product [Lactuca virosa]